MLREVPEVGVAGDQRHVVIDAGLGNEGVVPLRLETSFTEGAP